MSELQHAQESAESTGGPFDTTAIVVDFRSGGSLAVAISSLFGAGVASVIVVDNSPEGASKLSIEASDTRITLVHSGKNVGYGAAINLALPMVNSEFVVISNPDVVVDSGAVRRLGDLLVDPRVGVVGPKILNEDGSIYPSFRRFPSFVDSVGHGILGLFAPDNRFSVHYRLSDQLPTIPVVVPWVSGAFMMMSTAFLRSVGGFDAAYFMYCEDTDLCFRAAFRGYEVVYHPEATVIHAQGRSSDQRAIRSLFQHHRSMWIFAATHERSTLTQWAAFAGLTVRFFATAMISTFRRRINNAR